MKGCRGCDLLTLQLPAAAAAKLGGEFQRRGLDDLAQRRQVIIIELTDRSTHADRRHNFTSRRKHRRGNTTHADCVFFVINRIPAPADRGELLEQVR